jgi:RNA polymerase sigma-B factor
VRQQQTADLFALLPEGASRDDVLTEVVTAHMDLADRIARRFRGRGIEEDDLRQVAYLALFRAASKFDPDAGSDFLSYAVPTMNGEIRKHFRDHGWMVRPPRRIQDLQARVNGAQAELAHELGRAARPSEVAERLDVPLDEVIEALACDGCFTPTSLDRPVGELDAGTIGDLLSDDDAGQPDPSGFGAAEARVMLAPLVREMAERDRLVLELRYFRCWTQRQIGEELGISQMQVSRIISRILRTMREHLSGSETTDASLAPAV